MRVSAARTISIVTAVAAVSAVAVFGAQYASASSSHPAHGAKANTAYVFTTTSTGGTDQVYQTVPVPAKGVYAASFAANFYPAGSTTAPETFSCFLLKNGSMLVQSTSSSTYDSGFYVGVSGTTTVKVKATDSLTVGCGTADNTDWAWGTLPVTVTLTSLDALSSGTLAGSGHVTHSAGDAG